MAHVYYLIAGSRVEGAGIATAVESKNASDELTNKVPGPWRDVARKAISEEATRMERMYIAKLAGQLLWDDRIHVFIGVEGK